MKRSEELEDDYPENYQIGSLYSLNDFEPDEKEKGPKVRMGFHPPERAWIK